MKRVYDELCSDASAPITAIRTELRYLKKTKQNNKQKKLK